MREILARHASGSNLSETAIEMCMSASAAHNYMKEIKRILGMKSAAGCALKAYLLGYISEPDKDGRVSPCLPEGQEDTGRQAALMRYSTGS